MKHRDDLPQAPACARCNGEKSSLEHYLTAVLAFGGLHRDAGEILRTMVPKRLQRNAKLLRELQRGFTGEKLPLRPHQLERLFAFVTKGLLWHHWGTVLEEDDGIAVTMVQTPGVAKIAETLSKLGMKDRVVNNLGDGTFSYQGVQTIHSPHLTFWWYAIHGGMQFADSFQDPDARNSLILAITGPKALMPRFWASRQQAA